MPSASIGSLQVAWAIFISLTYYFIIKRELCIYIGVHTNLLYSGMKLLQRSQNEMKVTWIKEQSKYVMSDFAYFK
jgi:hypothetical protein